MGMDMSMPSLLAYFMTMIYNPNNVSIEASPMTTVAEIEVGKQLCTMFGYNVDDKNEELPVSWGHITCDGTVANLESVWVARNLKFYPLSLRNAMKEELSFVAPSLTVETCSGSRKYLKDLSLWELLNLKVPTILELPDRLYEEYDISPKFLETVMGKYTIQTVGKDTLERQYGIDKPILSFLGGTRHYSWPKAGAITGIGSDNIIGIDVDHGARLDLAALEKRLQACLDNHQAVYMVVAIMGSTEEGAVDPLRDIIRLREKFEDKGLSFVVHADAAWGGYFASMLPESEPRDILPLPSETGEGDGFVPDLTLRADTQEHLYMLRFADSITVDPHKAGYIPYPAGGLCYRDGRMRYQVTWTSPYISRGETTSSIGIFGVEGSKPGASAMSTWFSNVCIGLKPNGYGALLAEATFTCTRFSAQWAAMHTQETSFIVIPFNMLPSELKKDSTTEAVEEEREKIRGLLTKTNQQLTGEDLKLLRALGSDLNINAFACNFRYSDGRLNDDIEEANYLNRSIVEALSVDDPGDDPTSIPFFLTSTEFTQSLYGACATNFKKRLGLRLDENPDLFVLRNVVMNPFPTAQGFIGKLAGEFQKVVEEKVDICRKRNEIKDAHHRFIIQGTKNLYLTYLPSFHIANHRRQLIVSAKIISDEMMQKYTELRNNYPNETLILDTQGKEDLSSLLSEKKTFKAFIFKGGPRRAIIKDVDVTIVDVLKDHPLHSMHRDANYPSGHMPFYLYGTKDEHHIDHILVRSPNIQLSAENVQLKLADGGLPDEQLSQGAILYAEGVEEAAMQPFLTTEELLAPPGHSHHQFFFRPGQEFSVKIFRDPHQPDAKGPGLADVTEKEQIATGTMVLGERLYVDSDHVNKDPFKPKQTYARWKAEFDKIGRELD
jgi:glutamate/tyrosine decarboxylase-like PLP-dependent enzyme